MTTLADPHPPSRHSLGWLGKTEAWLDDRGKGAWIALMVLGFIFFWPLGLAVLAYMIWSKRMFSGNCAKRRHGAKHMSRAVFNTSGNSAFDAYKTETLRRLEDEQDAFEAFLQRLREAKDKAEFDEFMDERARRAQSQSRPQSQPEAGEDTAAPYGG